MHSLVSLPSMRMQLQHTSVCTPFHNRTKTAYGAPELSHARWSDWLLAYVCLCYRDGWCGGRASYQHRGHVRQLCEAQQRI